MGGGRNNPYEGVGKKESAQANSTHLVRKESQDRKRTLRAHGAPDEPTDCFVFFAVFPSPLRPRGHSRKGQVAGERGTAHRLARPPFLCTAEPHPAPAARAQPERGTEGPTYKAAATLFVVPPCTRASGLPARACLVSSPRSISALICVELSPSYRAVLAFLRGLAYM